MSISTAAEPRETAEQAPEPAGGHRPWRIRHLDRRGKLVVALIVVFLAVPFVASVARYVNDGWSPGGDNALIALRSRDVLSTHAPLLGQPSNAGRYAKDDPLHPGPIEFYLLSIPVRALGAAHGEVIGAALMSFAGVLGGLWAVFRRAGPRVALPAAVLIAALAWVAGQSALVNPISSNIGGIPLLALAFMAWAVLDGDVRLLPIAAFAFSFVAQQHLAILGLGLGLGAWLVLAAALAQLRWLRAQRPAADAGGIVARLGRGDPPDERPMPWIFAAVAVVLVCWAPVILDSIIHFPGNTWAIWRYSRASDHPSLGLSNGLTQMLRSVGLPPFLLRTNVTGRDMSAPIGPLAAASGVLMLAVVASIAVVMRRRRVIVSRLAVTTLWIALLGVIVGSKVPDSVEASRFSFYRWSIVLAIMVWLCVLWTAWELLAPRLAARRGEVRRGLLTSSVAAVAVISVLAATASGPRREFDEYYQSIDHSFAKAVRGAVDDGDSIGFIVGGPGSYLAVAPALTLDLIEHGHHVVVAKQEPRFYSKQRVAQRGDRVDRLFVIRDVASVSRDIRGKVLARYEPPGAALANRLAEEVRGQPIVPSAKGKMMAERAGGPGRLIATGIAMMANDPLPALTNSTTLGYLIDGYLDSPKLDRDQLIELRRQILRRTPVTATFELIAVQPADAAAAYPTVIKPDGTFR